MVLFEGTCHFAVRGGFFRIGRNPLYTGLCLHSSIIVIDLYYNILQIQKNFRRRKKQYLYEFSYCLEH